jgi:hypothetical protein
MTHTVNFVFSFNYNGLIEKSLHVRKVGFYYFAKIEGLTERGRAEQMERSS